MKGTRHRFFFAFLLSIFMGWTFASSAQLPLAQAAEKALPSLDLTTAIIQVTKQNIPDVVHKVWKASTPW
jgi:hypothetical protein